MFDNIDEEKKEEIKKKLLIMELKDEITFLENKNKPDEEELEKISKEVKDQIKQKKIYREELKNATTEVEKNRIEKLLLDNETNKQKKERLENELYTKEPTKKRKDEIQKILNKKLPENKKKREEDKSKGIEIFTKHYWENCREVTGVTKKIKSVNVDIIKLEKYINRIQDITAQQIDEDDKDFEEERDEREKKNDKKKKNEKKKVEKKKDQIEDEILDEDQIRHLTLEESNEWMKKFEEKSFWKKLGKKIYLPKSWKFWKFEKDYEWLRIEFIYTNFCLEKFLEQNEQQIYSEIYLLNLFKNVLAALSFSSNEIKPVHGNISLQTIYLNNNNWTISPPFEKLITIENRINIFEKELIKKSNEKSFGKNEEQKKNFLSFLLPLNYDEQEKNYLSSKFDMYCLGIIILHIIYNFTHEERKGSLKQEAIDKRLIYMKNYYSGKFYSVIANCVKINVNERSDLDTVVIDFKNKFKMMYKL